MYCSCKAVSLEGLSRWPIPPDQYRVLARSHVVLPQGAGKRGDGDSQFERGMLRLAQRVSSAVSHGKASVRGSFRPLGRELPKQMPRPELWQPLAKPRWLTTGAVGTRATFSGSLGKWIAGNAVGRGSEAAQSQIVSKLRVQVTTAADKIAGKGRTPNPYAIFIAVPIFILGVAFVGVDLITIATTSERKDVVEVLGQDWRDEKVQETIYCFIEESVVPKLVSKVEAALVKAGTLSEPEEGEAGDATRASNRRVAQMHLQKEAKMNNLLSWKAHRGVVAGPGPVIVPMSFEHPLPVSVVFCKEVVNATAPIYVRVNGSNTKPLQLTAHFVRDDTYYKLEAVSVVDREAEQVSTCVYSHDKSATSKTITVDRA